MPQPPTLRNLATASTLMRQQLVPRFPESNTLTLDRLFVTRSSLYGDLLCMIPFCLPLLVFPLLRNVANRNKAFFFFFFFLKIHYRAPRGTEPHVALHNVYKQPVYR
jgi:hypothetical protein